MNIYLLISTVSLSFQLLALALIVTAFEFKQRLRFRTHGLLMTTALLLHFIIIGTIMVPSFVLAIVPIILEKPTSMIGLITPFHVTVGTVTAILGVWIVGGWRLRQSTEFCAPKRKFMRATFILWLITISLGIIFYFVLNWSFLFG